MNIFVREPAVPMWLIGDMYQMAREVLFWSKKKRTDFHPKPRVASEKVLALLLFISENKNLNWKQRLEKWNRTYSQWKYNNENSMRVVYYRANQKRKPKERRA